MREYFNGRFSLTCLLAFFWCASLLCSLLPLNVQILCQKTQQLIDIFGEELFFHSSFCRLLECESPGRLSSAQNLNAHETWKMQFSVFWYFSSRCSLFKFFFFGKRSQNLIFQRNSQTENDTQTHGLHTYLIRTHLHSSKRC